MYVHIGIRHRIVFPNHEAVGFQPEKTVIPDLDSGCQRALFNANNEVLQDITPTEPELYMI